MDRPNGDATTLRESSEVNLLMKVQTASKDWDSAPQEIRELRKLLEKTGYEIDWSPKRLGINLLTPNKIRGMVLKRVLMKLYPFETFWVTESLDETLHKCFLVCQQLTLQLEKSIIWGQCSMTASYEFWQTVLRKAISVIAQSRSEEECEQEAKSLVVAALIASRGTDWDKQIARNFADGMGNQRLPAFVKSQKSAIALAQARQKNVDSKFNFPKTPVNYRPYSENQHKSEFGSGCTKLTTSTLTGELKKESQDMSDILKSIESCYQDNSVLQIDKAFQLGKVVTDLAVEFEGYMTANNRGAFKDVESITNHTDKVIRAMSKLTTAYSEFFLEFQKYFRNAAGGGDELSLSVAVSKLAELTGEVY